MDSQLISVDAAFSRQSGHYDAGEKGHPILRWMRHQARADAGTGLDAVFFAQQGCRVHATDLSQGMITELARKIEALELRDKITIQQCSFTALENVHAGPFDYVFSNFGGLNCAADLAPVISKLPLLLKPGGFVTVVMMPPICPWEIALIFRGHVKTAIRRLHRKGVMAHIEGVHFMAYYFTPAQVLRAFGKDFKRAALQGLASISPPPYMKNFPQRHPHLYKLLIAAEHRMARWPPFNSWADHFILTVQYLPVAPRGANPERAEDGHTKIPGKT